MEIMLFQACVLSLSNNTNCIVGYMYCMIDTDEVNELKQLKYIKSTAIKCYLW